MVGSNTQDQSPSKSGKQVLLVEDDETNQLIAKAMLDKLGYDITIVEHGEAALQACQSDKDFDLILMDIQMPVMDGITATQRLREQGISLPIIAMTANAMVGEKEKYLAAGMTDYISKPVYLDTLRDMLKRYLPR